MTGVAAGIPSFGKECDPLVAQGEPSALSSEECDGSGSLSRSGIPASPSSRIVTPAVAATNGELHRDKGPLVLLLMLLRCCCWQNGVRPPRRSSG